LVGFVAFVFLTPLAATSFNRAIKAMGARRWQVLHKLVYGVAGLGVLHFFWMRAGKNNFAEVAVYAVILGALLGWRVHDFMNKKRLQANKNKSNQLLKT
jgi:sulfoxide reductase heme-binding subunit YedZ